MSERWVVLNRYGNVDSGFFDDAEKAGLQKEDLEENCPYETPYTVVRIYTQAELDAAVAAEREACAMDCDALDNDENSDDYASAARWCATRIRARGGE